MLSDILNSLQKFAQIIEWGKDQTPISISVVWGNNLHFQFFDSYIPLLTTLLTKINIVLNFNLGVMMIHHRI